MEKLVQKTLDNYRSIHPVSLRVILGFLVLYLGVYFITLVLGVLPNFLLRSLGTPETIRLLIGGTISRGGMILGTIWLSVKIYQLTTGDQPGVLFFPTPSGWWKDLVFGALLGAGIMTILFGLQIRLGWLRVDKFALADQTPLKVFQTIWLALLANGLAAAGEEVMFRGYFLTGLKRVWNPWLSLLVMSLPFGAAHLLVSGAEETHWALFTLLLTLPGIMLGWAYLRSGSLWLPIGLHFTWNLFQDDILNLTGTNGLNRVGVLTTQQGPEWLVGTRYGIEVGAAGILGLLLAVLGIYLWTNRNLTGRTVYEH